MTALVSKQLTGADGALAWTHLQCVATHSLLQYSMSQSLLSTAGLVQPARMQMFGAAVEVALVAGATFTSTSI